MTDEQLIKALRCWAGKVVKEEECKKCPFGEDCTLGEIIYMTEKRLNELKEENESLRKQMNITLISGKKELPSDEEVIADIKKAMEYLQYQLEKLEGKQHGNQNKV